jgi:hypothetical protein
LVAGLSSVTRTTWPSRSTRTWGWWDLMSPRSPAAACGTGRCR